MLSFQWWEIPRFIARVARRGLTTRLRRLNGVRVVESSSESQTVRVQCGQPCQRGRYYREAGNARICRFGAFFGLAGGFVGFGAASFVSPIYGFPPPRSFAVAYQATRRWWCEPGHRARSPGVLQVDDRGRLCAGASRGAGLAVLGAYALNAHPDIIRAVWVMLAV